MSNDDTTQSIAAHWRGMFARLTEWPDGYGPHDAEALCRTIERQSEVIARLTRERDEALALCDEQVQRIIRGHAQHAGALARAEKAEAERDRMAAVLRDVRDDYKVMLAERIEDAKTSKIAQSAGSAIGYGALMVEASRQWREELSSHHLAGGEFVVGPCRGTAESVLRRIDAALAEGSEEATNG